MRIIYILFIYTYLIFIRFSSLFNSKAKLWVNGRKNIFTSIQSSVLNNKNKVYWFHCASLGEFEQARTLIEKIKASNENKIDIDKIKILLTFFSPSGYEIRKDYPFADYVFYLPIDTQQNAKRFISLLNPTKVFFVKYEFWFNYLHELKKKDIPVFLVSGIFRSNHYFFKWYSKWFRKQLNAFTYFFLQDEKSLKLLQAIGYKNSTVTGDTRFDRVYEISKNVKSISLINDFKDSKKLFVAGSTWLKDEKIISTFNFDFKEWKLVIAPHEINESHINSLLKSFKNYTIIRYSKATKENINKANILILDTIGLLSSIYQYGTIAYVGGGFGKGIHNILEPAIFGLPLIFGPNYKKFKEAFSLIDCNAAFEIKDLKEFEAKMQLLKNQELFETASINSIQYTLTNVGATEKIINKLTLY